MNKNEKEMCEFEMHLENVFVSALTYIIGNDDKISA